MRELDEQFDDLEGAVEERTRAGADVSPRSDVRQRQRQLSLTPSSRATPSESAIILSLSSVLPISSARNLNLEHREANGSMILG